MASTSNDWRASLSSNDRYDNIQNIKTALDQTASSATFTQKDAFSIENDAYKTSSSRDQYDAACRLLPRGDPSASVAGASGPEEQPPGSEQTESPGISIGDYTNCHYVASGVTGAVYRSKTTALKVIVETRNIEPHNPSREAKILALLKKPCIPLLETFRDQDQRFTLAFPFMPLSLEALIEQGSIPRGRVRSHFRELFSALRDLHGQGIIHRDIKPSAILLESPDGPAYLSDFGTAWHPKLSSSSEPEDQKILDIGTGPYRSPEALFGDKSYGPAVDMWGSGVMLAECCRSKPRPLFESRAAHEDGNQLGLILSIFKTIGSPTRESWPQAAKFRTPPFEMYQSFPSQDWNALLPDVDSDFLKLIKALVTFNTSVRVPAAQALQFECLRHESKA
ncbi:kinase-like domain-containing protein [Xylariaceae sp. FL0016]|nr:kinase-like domain-containing protein [Xylariaceae sp. FL0016]